MAYSFEVAHVQVLLHAVHDNARWATSVVQVVGVRTALILPVPQVYTQPQNAELLSELVKLKEEELLHDNPLRRECSEVCVCVMKTAPLQLVMLTLMRVTCELLSLTSHTPLSRIH